MASEIIMVDVLQLEGNFIYENIRGSCMLYLREEGTVIRGSQA
jgi:hypothetical protein